MMTIEMTVAKMGRSTKKRASMAPSSLGVRGRAGTALDLRARGRRRRSLGLHRDALRGDGDPRPSALDAVHDHPLPRRQATGDRTEAVRQRAELHLAVLDYILVVHDQHVLPTLIGA